MTGREQRGRDRTADVSGCARDQHLHDGFANRSASRQLCRAVLRSCATGDHADARRTHLAYAATIPWPGPLTRCGIPARQGGPEHRLAAATGGGVPALGLDRRSRRKGSGQSASARGRHSTPGPPPLSARARPTRDGRGSDRRNGMRGLPPHSGGLGRQAGCLAAASSGSSSGVSNTLASSAWIC
jgi:hypothetical protein